MSSSSNVIKPHYLLTWLIRAVSQTAPACNCLRCHWPMARWPVKHGLIWNELDIGNLELLLDLPIVVGTSWLSSWEYTEPHSELTCISLRWWSHRMCVSTMSIWVITATVSNGCARLDGMYIPQSWRNYKGSWGHHLSRDMCVVMDGQRFG